MEYKRQDLKAGGLSGQFETIKNFQIIKPSWRSTFGENFFLSSVGSLEIKDEHIENVLCIQEINGEEFVSSNDRNNELNVSVDGVNIYTGIKGESEKCLSLRGGYDKKSSGTITQTGEGEPNKDSNDVFEFGYIKLKTGASCEVGDYITFTSNESNLQGVTSRIHYKQGGFIYIRGTNLKGTIPTVGESIVINKKVGDIFVTATDKKVVSISREGDVIDIYECNEDDNIVDIEYFNGTIFILTKHFVFYGRSLINCNANVYPLDFFDNMVGGSRIQSFGKHLILFGQENQIISPVNGTGGSLGYISNGLNFNHKLYSKYSSLTTHGSLYILQEDKRFVKVDIVSVANGEYDLITDDALKDVKGMLDDIEGEVYMSKSDKYINILNKKPDGTTETFNYNTSYGHWVTWNYNKGVRSLGYYKYGDNQYTLGEDIVEQELSFQLGGEDLYQMKTAFFVKLVLVTEEKVIPNYTLTIEEYIAGKKKKTTINLKDYPIDRYIMRDAEQQSIGIGGNHFGETEMFDPIHYDDLGYIITPTITLNRTADMFKFILKNNGNRITYGGSVIGYKNWQPEVTAYNYNIKTK